MDKLAVELGIDPLELRMKNAIKPGEYTPTQVKTTLSNIGKLSDCLERLRVFANWNEGQVIKTEDGMIRAKGMGCFWKTSDSPVDAVSGVFLTFNTDGSINLNSGAVEIGPGMKAALAQILAEKLKMDVGRIHVLMGVDTQVSPEHWKTVASMTTFMGGRAVIRACEDLIKQLKSLAAVIMKSPPEDLDIGEEKVYLKQDTEIYVSFKDLARGYKQFNVLSVEGQILGRGSYIMSHITNLDKETGKGKPGPAWTVGAQAVEIEYDPNMFTYRLLKATTVEKGDGFFNRNIYIDDHYIGQRIVKISSGESRVWSNRGIPTEKWQQAFYYETYSFSQEGLEFAENIITFLLSSGVEPIYIDEIGPLELQEKGFHELFKSCLKSKKELYVVIRESCTKAVIEKYNIENYKIIYSNSKK